jgi:DNA-binding response OmpR family regulator
VSSLIPRSPILVVEPDLALRTSIASTLRQEGHLVLALGDPQVACEVARDNPLSLVVLDPVQMEVDDLALCQVIRANPLTEHVPIVLLLTREREIAQVEHLGLRITDYVLKPLLWEEFRACVQTLLRFRRQERPARRARPDHRTLPPALSQDETVLTAGDLSIDLGGRRVWHHGHLLELTRPVLFDLLVYLVRFRGIALTRKELLTQVWGYRTPEELNGDTHTVSVHIHWLRQLLEENPEEPQLVQTVQRIGYRFREEP